MEIAAQAAQIAPRPPVMLEKRPWFYFGCRGAREPGHYLFAEGMRHASSEQGRLLGKFDGALCFRDTSGYVAALSRFGNHGYSALAFWDYTGDTRSGSNSVFWAPGLIITAAEIIAGARDRFPSVMARLPEIDLRHCELPA